MLLEELHHNIVPKCKRHTSVIFMPSSYPRLRVGPQKVTEETRVRDFCGTYYLLNGVERRKLRAQAPMGAEYFIIYDSRDRQRIKAALECLP
eukprot:XP_001709712.1 Hypothetical protein GL50803_36897 [Giardia lamblia ATCC 50803]